MLSDNILAIACCDLLLRSYKFEIFFLFCFYPSVQVGLSESDQEQRSCSVDVRMYFVLLMTFRPNAPVFKNYIIF
jgi:hypothetical protein